MNKLIDCRAPNNFLGIKISAGKCYGTCLCDKTKCPEGYDKKFPNIKNNSTLTDEEKKFVKEAIDKGYPNKTCYEIAGNKCDVDFPDCKNNKNMFCETILKNNFQGKRCSDMFDQKSDDYKKCSSFFKLQKDIKGMAEGYHNYYDIEKQIRVRNKLRKVNDGMNDDLQYYTRTYNNLKNSLHTKNRLITINKEEEAQKSFYIEQIMSGSFFLLNMTIVVILNYMGKISNAKMYSILLTMIGISIFYIFFWQKVKAFPKHLVEEVDKSIKKTQLSTQEWVDENCDCPDDYDPTGQNIDYKGYQNSNNNIFHNDGMNVYSDFI